LFIISKSTPTENLCNHDIDEEIMITQAPSLDITMSLGEKDDNILSYSERNIEQNDTMDISNCATSPSKATYLSSVPGTIYYNGLDSVNQPHIENARKVTESHIFDESDAMPQKTRHTRHRVDSHSSSVPRMQWTPPQPLSGNDPQVQSSTPQYTAKAYAPSAVANDILPAIPVEELSMDGFTDTVLKRGVEKICCGKIKAYKALLILTAIVIVLAISAVIFSFVYVATSDADDTQEKERRRHCHPECYDPSQPTYICRCACYTSKDDRYYRCGSHSIESNYTGQYDDQSDGNEIGNSGQGSLNVSSSDSNELDSYDNDDSFDGLPGDGGNNSTWYTDDTDDDTDEFSGDLYDDSVRNADCADMCYRKNVHRDWNPSTCNPSCYETPSLYKRRHELWMEWFIHDDVTSENDPSDRSSQTEVPASLVTDRSTPTP